MVGQPLQRLTAAFGGEALLHEIGVTVEAVGDVDAVRVGGVAAADPEGVAVPGVVVRVVVAVGLVGGRTAPRTVGEPGARRPATAARQRRHDPADRGGRGPFEALVVDGHERRDDQDAGEQEHRDPLEAGLTHLAALPGAVGEHAERMTCDEGVAEGSADPREGLDR